MHIVTRTIIVLILSLSSLYACGGGGGDVGRQVLSPCDATELLASNGAFIACDPVLIDGGPALQFELEGRLVNYDGNRVIVSAFTMYSERNCQGQVGLFDFQGIGITNNYGISVDGDVYLSDGSEEISWQRMSKVLNRSGDFVCSNESLGDPGPFFEARVALDHTNYPTPYSIVSVGM